MKTLYISINKEQIQSNDELEVLNYDLDSDFFFYLGEKIAKGCKVENENALITDFNTQDNAENYQKIIAQWHGLKTILFGEKCEGEFKFVLPDGYIHWLRYSGKYNHVYDKNFSHGESPAISIDLEELYEESVEDLQRKILRKLQRDDLHQEIDEIVFNDDVVTRKSPIVCNIKEKYDGVGFKTYKKWLEENEEKPHTSPQVCHKHSFECKLTEEQAVEALVNWVCIGYYNESNIDLRNDENTLSRIKIEAIKVVKRLKSENAVDLMVPYISSRRYMHIHVKISREKLQYIASKSFYEKSDFPECISSGANDHTPETITCPLCGFMAEYDGDVYYCINCKIYLMEGYGKVCPRCHADDVVEDLDGNTCYCLKCKKSWIE